MFMSTGFTVFLTAAALLVICLTASAASKRPGSQWDFFHFDGHAFVAGRPADGASAIVVSAGRQPVLWKPGGELSSVPLAPGNGALAGICYLQSVGGKLGGGPSYLPSPHFEVQIRREGKIVLTTQTDEQGYFQATLAPGRYQVGNRRLIDVTVEQGSTKLVTLRVGKRMVD
jgi:hypothetical protein